MRTLSQPTVGLDQVVGLIPARWNSSRFEGKPLELINGVPMIQRVYNQCIQTESLDRVVVLTDDVRINQYCASNEIPCIVVESNCITGTDRCAKAIELLDGDYFVNIQGDEPVIDPFTIDTLVRNFIFNDKGRYVADAFNRHIGNAYVEILDDEKLHDRNVVKVVMDKEEKALFYSRLPIPYPKGDFEQYYQQLGLYIFSRKALQVFSRLPRLSLEKSEEVEMLRFLENGYTIHMTKVKDVGLSVDVPEDIITVEKYLNDIQHH